MSSPFPIPKGRSFNEGHIPVAASGSPKGNRLSEKVHDLRGFLNLGSSSSASASTSTTPTEIRVVSNSLINWQQALQQTSPIDKENSQIPKEKSPTQIEIQFHSLYKVLKCPEISQNRFAIVYDERMPPHIRLDQKGSWTHEELIGGISKVLNFMELAIAASVFQFNSEVIVELGDLLFKNPHALRILNEKADIRERWIRININYRLEATFKIYSKPYKLLTSALPSIQFLCNALLIRQKKIIEKIKERLHPDDLKEQTLERKNHLDNLDIIRHLDLWEAYTALKSNGFNYFEFMSYITKIVFTPEGIAGYTDKKFEPHLSAYLCFLHYELEVHFTKFVPTIKEEGGLLRLIESEAYSAEAKIIARDHYNRHNYQEALNINQKSALAITNAFGDFGKFGPLLNQLVHKGNRYLIELEKQAFPIKEKMTPEECVEIIENMLPHLYPSIVTYLESRLQEYKKLNKPTVAALEERLTRLKEFNKKHIALLSKLYYDIENETSPFK